jgi:hypothetical protein
MASHQEPGKWTTPFGPNVRYTVRLHVVGEDKRDDGSARGADRYEEIRVVTPLGQLRAAALAATHFAAVEPRSVFREIEIAEVEHDFTIAGEDYRDSESFGR